MVGEPAVRGLRGNRVEPKAPKASTDPGRPDGSSPWSSRSEEETTLRRSRTGARPLGREAVLAQDQGGVGGVPPARHPAPRRLRMSYQGPTIAREGLWSVNQMTRYPSWS